MNVLILIGSPRRVSNTAELCKPFIEEMKENGAAVRYVTLADKNINPCKGCYACQQVEGSFYGFDDLGGQRINLEFCWVPLESLPGFTVYPQELIPHIVSGASETVHFVSHQL